MTVLVTYASGTGYTATYAAWIAGELGADLVDVTDLKRSHINTTPIIVFGGGLRAGRILGLKRFLKHWHVLAGKKVVLFHTGLNPGNPEDVEKVWEKNLTPEQRASAERFYLLGGFDFAKLTGLDKLIMWVMRFRLRRKKDPTAEEAAMLTALETPRNELDRSAIAPIVTHVRSLASS